MNRLQRAVSLAKPAQTRPSSTFGALGGMFYGASGSGNGQFEVATADLGSVAQQLTKRNGQVYALMEWRRRAFSDVRFLWQHLRSGVPGDFWSNADLDLLTTPWPNGTTKALLNRLISDADHLGNAYVTHHPTRSGRLRRLRPDWVFTVWGSDEEPELFGDALDAELLGYVYAPRTRGMFEPGPTDVLLPEEVAHFAPTPDPESHGMGMSWLTPIVREIATDAQLVRHKELFFENGASPRMVVKVNESVDEDEFRKLKALIDSSTLGDNLHKTLYLAGGADPTMVSVNLKDADYGAISAAGEVRLANAAGVPAPVAGLAAALQGSSLNAGNLTAEITKIFIDMTIRDLWAAAAGALESILTVPSGGNRLWYDTRDTALTQDAKAAAEIRTQDAATLASLDMAGYTSESAVKYIASGDPTTLKHSGKDSVQRQPGSGQQPVVPVIEPKPDEQTSTTDTGTTEGE